MANHKRRKPKNSRAGCLLCHPYKMNGCPPKERFRFSDYRKMCGWEKKNPTIQN